MASEDQQAIADQITQLEQQLQSLAENRPDNPVELARWAEKVNGLKSQLSQQRKAQQRLDEREVQDKQSELSDNLDPYADRTPEEQAAYDAAIGRVDPEQMQQYQVGDAREVGDNELIDPITGRTSAWDDAQSAYDALGPSAYEGLELSPEQLAAMGEGRDYFGALMRGGGRDAVSDAEYARRTADAEQVRRASTDAALEAEEMRGGGSAGARVLAEQVASQGQASDLHRAGMDANALAQQRRDAAGSRYYDMSRGIAQDEFSADATRAGGLDAYGTTVAGGQDRFTGAQASGLDQSQQYYDALAQDAARYNAGQYTGAADANWSRGNYVADANVDVANQTTAGNAQANAAGTGAYMSALGLEGGQTLGQGGLNLQRDQFQWQKSQAPGGFERFVQNAVPFVGMGAGLAGQLARDDEDDD